MRAKHAAQIRSGIMLGRDLAWSGHPPMPILTSSALPKLTARAARRTYARMFFSY